MDNDNERKANGILRPGILKVLGNQVDVASFLASGPQDFLVKSIAGEISLEDFQAQFKDSKFIRDLDQLQEQLFEQAEFHDVAAGAAVASSSSLAVGYVLWLFRGGALVSGFLSSMAAWPRAVGLAGGVAGRLAG